MGPLRYLVLVGMLSLARTCPADVILTLTPTARVDSSSQVTISYTMSAAAGSTSTQSLTDYFFQINGLSAHPFWPTQSSGFLNITKAGNNTVWGPGGPFGTTSVIPNLNSLRYQTTSTSGAAKTIDSTGGVVGTFDVTWNRLIGSDYDAAITTQYILGGYNSGGSQFLITPAVGAGVSTLISSVPEPGTTTLFLLTSCSAIWWRRRRNKCMGDQES